MEVRGLGVVVSCFGVKVFRVFVRYPHLSLSLDLEIALVGDKEMNASKALGEG